MTTFQPKLCHPGSTDGRNMCPTSENRVFRIVMGIVGRRDSHCDRAQDA